MNFTENLDQVLNEINYLKQCEKKLEEIVALPNCQDCAISNNCEHRPKYGDFVRFNCPLYIS